MWLCFAVTTTQENLMLNTLKLTMCEFCWRIRLELVPSKRFPLAKVALGLSIIQLTWNAADEWNEKKLEVFRSLHSDKSHDYKLQPGGLEEIWRAEVPGWGPGGGSDSVGRQGRRLGQKPEHWLSALPQSNHSESMTTTKSSVWKASREGERMGGKQDKEEEDNVNMDFWMKKMQCIKA